MDTLISLKIHDNNAAKGEMKEVCLDYTHKVTSLYCGQDISPLCTLLIRKERRLSKKIPIA